MTATLAPEISKPKESVEAAAERRRYTKFAATYVCGFHQTGDGTRCRGAVRNARKGVLRCSAYSGPVRCLDCNSVENVNETEWSCIDASECRATIAKRQSENRAHQQLMSIKATIAADAARRDRAANQVRREVREAVARGERVTVMTPNGEEELEAGDWLWEDAFDAPAPPKKAKTGACRCCGEETRGGKFLPGHDAKLKSLLKKQLQNGSDEEREAAQARLVEEGWAA